MTNKELIERLRNVAELPTIYIKGGIGRPLTAANKKKAIEQYSYNKGREKKIMAASSATFGFDCIGSVKSVLWGFNGDITQPLGGAVYESNGYKDVTEKGFLDNYCIAISSDMNNLTPGEFLWLKGHCGVYLGNGEVFEATPSYKDGAQITKLSQRKWLKHGLIQGIAYGKVEEPKKQMPLLAPPTIRRGNKGTHVALLQADLNFIGYKLDEDGICGPISEAIIRDFQKMANIRIDGIYGPQTKNALYEFMKGGKLCR